VTLMTISEGGVAGGAASAPAGGVAVTRRRTFQVLVVAVALLLLAMLLRSSYVALQSDLYSLSTADREDRQNALEAINLVEDVLISVALAVLVIGLLYGALVEQGLSDLVRLGLLLAVAIIVGLFLARAMW
jgi:hypothetical protein